MSEASRKRDSAAGSSLQSKRSRTECTFKEKCYRRNPHHFREYDHQHLEKYLNQDTNDITFPDDYLNKEVVIDQIKILKDLRKPTGEAWKNFKSTDQKVSVKLVKRGFAEKLEKSSPYNLFFTTIPESKETHTQAYSIKFTDLLCPSLGTLESSLQINFMLDIMWVMERYQEMGQENKPMTVVFGEDFPNMMKYIRQKLPNVTPHLVKMQDPFGTHHSKLGIYAYTDGSIRVVVSTANLYYEDWNRYCQGLWISPSLPPLNANQPDSDGVGPTAFKTSLINYLSHYKIPCLDQWIQKVKRADFTEVKVFFVGSVPGKHPPNSSNGHLQRVGDLLSRHCVIPSTDGSENPLSWSIIAQSSSLGNMGPTPAAWLRCALLRSLASHKKCPLPGNSSVKLSLIFPSMNNVLNSYYGLEGGGCLPYGKKVHEKQTWLQDYLHEWKAEKTSRSKAMPHIKTYCRVSPCHKRLAWFLITSSNISKAAWGTLNKTDSNSYVRSYEAGVMFIPSFFDEEYFTISGHESDKKFPFIYDLPLVPYKGSDKPFCQ